MAIMLRTQGIPTRVVNGFHGGDYNDAADLTVVRQKNAHSWVEVYFPKEDVWVKFDPTPASNDVGAADAGFVGQFKKYMEAAEAFWIQNFVAYDDQGQRSLLHSIRNGVVDSQQDLAEYFAHAKALFEEWWADVKGANGSEASWSCDPVGGSLYRFGLVHSGPVRLGAVQGSKIKGLETSGGASLWRAETVGGRVLRTYARGFSGQRLCPAGASNTA